MESKKIVAYISPRDLSTLTKEDVKCLSVINLAFGVLKNGEVCFDMGENQIYLQKAKEINPDLKVVLSIGGWSSGGFSEAASSKEGRELFTKSAVSILKAESLDGLDLDWEYPCIGVAGIGASKDDKENFTLLIQRLREELDLITDRYCMLTIAAGGDSYYTRCTNMDQVEKYLDYVQLMTYDLRGGFTLQTGHHTGLYTNAADLNSASTDHAVQVFLAAGVPKEKLVIGAAFYSRMWKNVPNRNHGLMQVSTAAGGFGPSYSTLLEKYIDKNGYTRYWDDEAKAPYLYSEKDSIFITYDDPQSIAEKARYAEEKGLLGIMYWEYSCDATRTLTKCIYDEWN